MARRFMAIARCGRCSEICTPGTLVEMGRNSPRISAGASGLRSYRSIWLGPPPMTTWITAVSGRDLAAVAASARQRRESANVKVPNASDPTSSKVRREIRRLSKLPDSQMESMIFLIGDD